MEGEKNIREAYASLLHHDFEQAIRWFERAVQEEPDNADYHHKLSISYARSGKLAKALKHAARACELDADAQEYRYHYRRLQALELIRKSPVHMGIVVDEYGTLQGVVTITDITEAMVGTIRESDRAEEPEATRRDDGSWLVDGLMPIPEVKQVIGMTDIPEDEGFHTLAGFIMWKLGRLPKTGDAFDWNGWRVEVADMDGRRIDKVSLRPPVAAPTSES